MIAKKFAVNKCLVLIFERRGEMCQMMKQYAEHYENPKFMGLFPTIEAIDSWALEEFQEPYERVYDGFNFPSTIVREWDAFRRSSAMERKLFHTRLTQEILENGYTYVIAVRDGNGVTLAHELAHYIWFMNPEYKHKVKKAIKGSCLGTYLPQFAKLGYDKKVWLDEANAILASEGDLGEYLEVPKEDRGELKWIGAKLAYLYSEYLAKEMMV